VRSLLSGKGGAGLLLVVFGNTPVLPGPGENVP
jgi:hypothetical protein